VQVSHDKQQARSLSLATDDPVAPELEIGVKICVRNRFLGDWSSGFEVAEIVPDGCRIRRVSDGLTFPDVFSVTDVRLERRQESERGIAGSYLDRRL
jgi:hypothetical protein